MRGTVITFYSYKGGVGRTLALANAATLLSIWGHRVLCIDWDLEAPGLHRYFERWLSASPSEGLVELIAEQGAGKETDWRRRVQTVSFLEETAKGASLDFLAAGRLDTQYVERLQELDWEALYRDARFGEWLEGLRTTWKEEYDFILIDSRTGFTDLGGICTIQLPDILVLLFTASQQSLEGILDVAQRASERQGQLPFDRASLPCVPVPTRFEARVELEIAKEWLEKFATRLSPLYRDWLAADVEPRQLLDVLRIPYVPYWSFGEKMPVLDEGIRDPESLGFAFATLTALLAHDLGQTELLVTRRDEFVDAAGAMAEVSTSVPTPKFVDETALRAAYLGSVAARTQYLSLGEIGPAGVADKSGMLNVEAIYTPLWTVASGGGHTSSRLQPASDQLALHARLVLLGDLGSGKSTFARFVALSMAREASRHPEPWGHGALTPVWISLPDFAARGLPSTGERVETRHLWSYIATDLAASGLGEFLHVLRRDLLSQGGLLILDGLDEVPESEGRREQVCQAIEDFSSSFNRCRVLVTCRTYAYQSQGRKLHGFTEAVLAPFDDSQIDRFIQGWYSHLAVVMGLEPAQTARYAELLLHALGNRHLRELARSPLLLTMMASFHTWRGGLPDNREELYAGTVDLLLYGWERQRLILDSRGQSMLQQPSLAEFRNVGRETVRAVLEEVAFEAHGAKPASQATGDIAESRLVGHLLRMSRNPEVKPLLLIDYLQNRAGLLESRGAGVYTFSHRIFQEYLAACHLLGEDFPDRLAELVRADPLRWREIAFLAAAKAARGAAAAVWSLAEALCWREPDSPRREVEDVWGALIAGQLISELADLRRVSWANEPKLERLSRWLVLLLGEQRLPATERCLAGRYLAKLGDPRQKVMTIDGMSFCQVAEGPFQMGGEAGDPQTLPDELPAHMVELPYGYWIGRYPVTVAQYREFVEASGYKPEQPGCLTGVQNHPVVQVSWRDGIAFCLWLTKHWRAAGRLNAGQAAMLPSEAEWEKAARGFDARRYAWGQEEATPERANFVTTGIDGASTVGCFPAGASPFGCEEMSGNVWEWTRSLWGQHWEAPAFAYPYRPDDGREDLEASPKTLRILRGGSYINSSRDIRCTSRTALPPGARNDGTGFRVVLVPTLSAS